MFSSQALVVKIYNSPLYVLLTRHISALNHCLLVSNMPTFDLHHQQVAVYIIIYSSTVRLLTKSEHYLGFENTHFCISSSKINGESFPKDPWFQNINYLLNPIQIKFIGIIRIRHGSCIPIVWRYLCFCL